MEAGMSERAVTLDREAELAMDLDRIKRLVEASDVEGARAFAREFGEKWPESPQVAYWCRVLAPPRVIGRFPATGRSFEPERECFRQHAAEYPGCWIAVYGDQLVAASPDRQAV